MYDVALYGAMIADGVRTKAYEQALRMVIKPDSVVLEVNGQQHQIPNDYVWVFAGGIPPNDFLKKIGIGFGKRDMTVEASNEAKQAAQP